MFRMYGLIGKMIAKPGARDALVTAMLDGIEEMPGCFSYVVAHDPTDENAIWVTEVWDSKESHEGSLALPAVKDAIAKVMPLIESFAQSVVTTPVGGHGLKR
jgi:quinol monooxygenase YgiN